jgi:glutamine cyclotransferase
MLSVLLKTIVPLGLCVLILSACGTEPERRSIDRPSINSGQAPLNIKAEAESIIYGDTLRFEVLPVKDAPKMIQATASLADTRSLLGSTDDGKFVLPSALTGGGMVKLRIDATFEDGTTSLRYKDFKVSAPQAPLQWSLEVQRRYPHDKSAFTQGLLFHNGYLYEGTGNIGESRIRKLELETGEVLMEKANKADIFGEGITIMNDKLYQVTYKTARGFIYRLSDFELMDEFSYNTLTGEGWGLTHNDTSLIMSDGSAYLYFYHPEQGIEQGRIRVFDERGDVNRLNELEYKDGVIYANIYTTADIVAIDAKTGLVLHRYSARGMVDRSEATPQMDVLNGIAIHPLNGNLLLTGKYWSTIYEVKPVMQ